MLARSREHVPLEHTIVGWRRAARIAARPTFRPWLSVGLAIPRIVRRHPTTLNPRSTRPWLSVGITIPRLVRRHPTALNRVQRVNRTAAKEFGRRLWRDHSARPAQRSKRRIVHHVSVQAQMPIRISQARA